MKLEQFASPLLAEDNYIKASFGGFQGSGKTRTATELIIGCYKEFNISKPLLLIDNEKGGRFLIPIFQKAGIKVYQKQTSSLADVLDGFELLNSKEIDFLFIDSLTKVWYQFVRDYKAKNKITFMSLQDWGKILPVWQEKFSDKFVELKGSCIFTGRAGYQYEKEEDTVNESGQVVKKGQFVKSGTKMKMAGETPFETDLNVWMEFQQEINNDGVKSWVEAQILKDRSDTISWKIFKNPTFNDFAPVISFLKQVPIGEVSKQTNNQNLAPSENWASYENKQNKQIELEKIQSLFDLQGFSPQSKDDKALKISIIKKFFGTTSQTEIDTLAYANLHNVRLQLDDFFKGYKDAKDKHKYIEEYILPEEKELQDKDPLGLVK